ncbi:unnamed protein product [Prorocentrum cordatum]|uniref:Uncharacterized protein n=1 Tax=Prorocentrum cordatum TaxID=2364126 RepID=A0ABN9XG02_9DINO|nr:unnamed protein product [Polarella glacialis]
MRAVAAARGALARAAARRPGAPPVAGRQGAQAGGASAYAPVTQAGRLLLARGADEPGRPPEETRSGLRGWPPAAPASRGPGSRAPGPGRTSSATGTCPEPEPRVIWAEHLLREMSNFPSVPSHPSPSVHLWPLLLAAPRSHAAGMASRVPLHPGLAGSRLVLAPRCGTARLRSRRWPPAVRARPPSDRPCLRRGPPGPTRATPALGPSAPAVRPDRLGAAARRLGGARVGSRRPRRPRRRVPRHSPAAHPLPRARGSTDPRPGAARPGRPVQASLPACDAGRRPSATWPRHRIVSSDLVAGSSSSYIQHCAVVCGHQLALALADDRTFKVMHRSAAFRHLWRGLTRGRATGHPRPQLYRGRSPSVLLSIAADCL